MEFVRNGAKSVDVERLGFHLSRCGYFGRYVLDDQYIWLEDGDFCEHDRNWRMLCWIDPQSE